VDRAKSKMLFWTLVGICKLERMYVVFERSQTVVDIYNNKPFVSDF